MKTFRKLLCFSLHLFYDLPVTHTRSHTSTPAQTRTAATPANVRDPLPIQTHLQENLALRNLVRHLSLLNAAAGDELRAPRRVCCQVARRLGWVPAAGTQPPGGRDEAGERLVGMGRGY
jgi:hypothetical protein